MECICRKYTHIFSRECILQSVESCVFFAIYELHYTVFFKITMDNSCQAKNVVNVKLLFVLDVRITLSPSHTARLHCDWKLFHNTKLAYVRIKDRIKHTKMQFLLDFINICNFLLRWSWNFPCQNRKLSFLFLPEDGRSSRFWNVFLWKYRRWTKSKNQFYRSLFSSYRFGTLLPSCVTYLSSKQI
jgi:hypothetical protein